MRPITLQTVAFNLLNLVATVCPLQVSINLCDSMQLQSWAHPRECSRGARKTQAISNPDFLFILLWWQKGKTASRPGKSHSAILECGRCSWSVTWLKSQPKDEICPRWLFYGNPAQRSSYYTDASIPSFPDFASTFWEVRGHSSHGPLKQHIRAQISPQNFLFTWRRSAPLSALLYNNLLCTEQRGGNVWTDLNFLREQAHTSLVFVIPLSFCRLQICLCSWRLVSCSWLIFSMSWQMCCR